MLQVDVTLGFDEFALAVRHDFARFRRDGEFSGARGREKAPFCG